MSKDTGADRVLVVIPTYDEADNIADVTHRLAWAVPDAHVLIADDDSPDGTGGIADGLAEEDDHVHVLHRPAGARGPGAACLAGFRWGMERGFDVLVQMDADGSHRPEELPRLLAALGRGADLVVGSRWVPGGRVVDWPPSREWLSRRGSACSRFLLRLPVRDVTSGFRALRAHVMEGVRPGDVDPAGYCFQVDLLRHVVGRGFRVAEVPITFVERQHGEGKMTRALAAGAMWRVVVWGAHSLPWWRTQPPCAGASRSADGAHAG